MSKAYYNAECTGDKCKLQKAWGEKVRCDLKETDWYAEINKDYEFWWNVKSVPVFTELRFWRMLTNVPNKDADIKVRLMVGYKELKVIWK